MNFEPVKLGIVHAVTVRIAAGRCEGSYVSSLAPHIYQRLSLETRLALRESQSADRQNGLHMSALLRERQWPRA